MWPREKVKYQGSDKKANRIKIGDSVPGASRKSESGDERNNGVLKIIEKTDEEMVILQPEETKNRLFLHFFSRLCKPHFIDGPGKLSLTEVK